jgi:MoaA/NifB/PqqE/SkfB family radical SAM enzyme
MCDIWKSTSADEISAENLRHQLASIRHLGVQWVVFSGGEPLMHSNLWELCAILRDRRIRITLLTSGLLLSRYAAPVAEWIDDVIVSLDGPPAVHDAIRGIPRAFELLASGVKDIRKIRLGFRISARCTVQSRNFRFLNATVDTARELGLDSISFLAADLTSSAFNRPAGWQPARQTEIAIDPEDLPLLDLEIDTLIARSECGGFVLETPAKLRRVADHFGAHFGMAPAVAPTCNAPWISAVIEADGSVRPCFFHRSVGNLKSGKSLHEIANGPEAISFRRSLNVMHNPICQRCVCSLNWSAGL